MWGAGLWLAEFLMSHQKCVEGQRVLELGAGVGLTGHPTPTCYLQPNPSLSLSNKAALLSEVCVQCCVVQLL